MKNNPFPPVTHLHHRRILALSIAIFFLFSLLIARFFSIQITQGEYWSKIGDKQHYFTVKEPFQRGIFYSNLSLKKGNENLLQPLVYDIQKYHLYADVSALPAKLKNPITHDLAAHLHLNEVDKRRLANHLTKKSRSRKLAMWLEKNERDAILQWWLPFAKEHKLPRNALFFVSDYQRSYPFGNLLGQVLHTVQGIKDEKTLQGIPTGGLELYFNDYLKGRQGKRRLMRSPRNSLEIGEMIAEPQNGADVYLTINHYLQAIVEQELAAGVISCRAKSGWAAMMDPFTGEVLALAQYPFFHPGDYQRYFNDPSLIEHTKVKAITDAQEPGSIMKPITIAVALKANDELTKRGEKPLFDPEEMMPTANSHFPGRRKPLKDTHFHAYLNMQMAIQKSSNIYVARLVEKIIARLGNDWYRNVLYQDFGIGRKTGIELPSESIGSLSTPGKKHPNGVLEWSASTPYSMAMGHNMQVTSLQTLRAHAIFANGGFLVKPTLVKKIVRRGKDGKNEILLDHSDPLLKKPNPRVVSEKIAKQIATAMKFTTKNGGTARKADVWGYSEAGKTGTADKVIGGAYRPEFVCASFVGFVPAEKPAFVLIVTMDEPAYGYIHGLGRNHMGGTCSAPVFREISKRSLEYLGIPPNDPHGYPPGDPRFHSEKADWMPEIKQLQEKYEKWNNKSGH